MYGQRVPGWTFDGLQSAQQRDGFGVRHRSQHTQPFPRGRIYDPLPAHEGGYQGWVNGCVYARLSPTDDSVKVDSNVLHADGAVEAAGEPEVHKRWKFGRLDIVSG